MLYFKHTELATQYHVSLRTVHNWIDATKQGKLDLVLHTVGDKSYVANTAKNVTILTELVESRRKYRNTRASKVVTPHPEFYELYNSEQIHDIITSLEVHHEIPRQYNYFDGGATRWAHYTERLASEDSPNLLNSTLKLMRINQGYIDDMLSKYKRVNVVDVGVGNAYPAKDFLVHLLQQDKLGRYIALDISPAMLKLAKANINEWFGDKVKFEGYECDINYDRFSKFLVNEYVNDGETSSTVNVVLLFGGTLSNMRYPDNGYRMIHGSMGLNDFLIHATKLDTEGSRKYFDFSSDPGNTTLSPNHRLIFDLLDIDESFYEVEMGYDVSIRERYIRVRLGVTLTIRFVLEHGVREVFMHKGDTILLWRGLQQTPACAIEQFGRNDFDLLHTSLIDDQEYILTVSRVKRG